MSKESSDDKQQDFIQDDFLSEEVIREIAKDEIEKANLAVKFNDSDPDTNPSRFENRRKMAWLSLFSILIITGIIIFYVKPLDVENYTTILAWVYSVLSAIVLAYFGASTYQYTSFLSSKKDKP